MASRMSKEELREMMRQRKEALAKEKAAKPETIDSPLARVDEKTGRLTCILCNVEVKSAAFWSQHLQGKIHKDRLEAAKKQRLLAKERSALASTQVAPKPSASSSSAVGSQAQASPNVTQTHSFRVTHDELKRKAHDIEHNQGPAKLAKVEPLRPTQSTPASNRSLLERLEKEEDGEDEEQMDDSEDQAPGVPEGLPANFFDQPAATRASPERDTEENPDPVPTPVADSGDLPKGFFDDPKLEAKARQVVYKDPLEDELEKFQRAIAEETLHSNALIEHDLEEIESERTIEEIDEQIKKWERINELEKALEEKKKSKARSPDEMDIGGDDSRSSTKVQTGTGDEDEDEELNSEDEEEDLDAYLEANVFTNWRSKGASLRKLK